MSIRILDLAFIIIARTMADDGPLATPGWPVRMVLDDMIVTVRSSAPCNFGSLLVHARPPAANSPLTVLACAGLKALRLWTHKVWNPQAPHQEVAQG